MVIEYKFKYIIYFPHFTIGGIQREVDRFPKEPVTRRRTADEINQGLFNETPVTGVQYPYKMHSYKKLKDMEQNESWKMHL